MKFFKIWALWVWDPPTLHTQKVPKKSEKRGYLLFGNRRGGRVSEEGRRGGADRGWEGVVWGGGGGLDFFFFSKILM